MGHPGKPYSKTKMKRLLSYYGGSFNQLAKALGLSASNLTRIYNGGGTHTPTMLILDRAHDAIKKGTTFKVQPKPKPTPTPEPSGEFGSLLRKVVDAQVQQTHDDLEKSVLSRLEGKLNRLEAKMDKLLFEWGIKFEG